MEKFCHGAIVMNFSDDSPGRLITLFIPLIFEIAPASRYLHEKQSNSISASAVHRKSRRMSGEDFIMQS